MSNESIAKIKAEILAEVSKGTEQYAKALNTHENRTYIHDCAVKYIEKIDGEKGEVARVIQASDADAINKARKSLKKKKEKIQELSNASATISGIYNYQDAKIVKRENRIKKDAVILKDDKKIMREAFPDRLKEQGVQGKKYKAFKYAVNQGTMMPEAMNCDIVYDEKSDAYNIAELAVAFRFVQRIDKDGKPTSGYTLVVLG